MTPTLRWKLARAEVERLRRLFRIATRARAVDHRAAITRGLLALADAELTAALEGACE